jgi:hypothetical protein
MTTLLLAALLAQTPPPRARAIDVVVMVDVSDSMLYGVWAPNTALVHDVGVTLAHAFVRGDAMRIGTFGETVVLHGGPLRSPAEVREAADALNEYLGGPSPVWDALVAAASVLEGDVDAGRRGIVLLTDGRSTANRLGFADALARLQRDRIPVFVVAIDMLRNAVPDPKLRLITLAKTTGGTYVFADPPAAASAGVARAIGALRASATAR